MMNQTLRFAATAVIVALAGLTISSHAAAAGTDQAAAPLMLAAQHEEDAMSGEGDAMSEDAMSEDSMSQDDAMQGEHGDMKKDKDAMEGESMMKDGAKDEHDDMMQEEDAMGSEG